MTLKIRTHDKLIAVIITIHAVWSVLVATANGGYCPGGTGKGESVADMIPSVVATQSSVGITKEEKRIFLKQKISQ